METATTHATNFDGKNGFVLKKSDTNNTSAIEKKCKKYKSKFLMYIGNLDVKRAPTYACFGEMKRQ